jgi:hypothetical protein
MGAIMEPLEFLAAVLPFAENYYCVAEFDSRQKEHIFGSSLEELAANAAQFDRDQKDAYFALAAYKHSGDRTAENAKVMRSFFLDIDCAEDGPKTYANKELGIAAFNAFLTKTGLDKLGVPLVVDSGGGYHVYWPLTANIDIAQWKPVAENFKRLCKQEGLRIDFSVPADAARVLRVPGTTNWKRVRKYGITLPVVVWQEPKPETFDFNEFATLVKENLTDPVPVFDTLPGKKPSLPKNATTLKLFENSATFFKSILQKTAKGEGCGQLKYYLDNAQEDGMEPLWRGLLSIAVKCEDGVKAANFLTDRHPYTKERMAQKLREIKGPYPCVKFDSENPGVCAGCKHFGKITNPLALGREVKVETEEKILTATPANQNAVDVAEAAQITYVRPSPPRGFAYGGKGGIYREVEIPTEAGDTTKEMKMILSYDLFIMDILKPVGGDHTVHMVALRPEGAVDILFPQKVIISKDELAKALAAQNIIAAFGAGNDAHLFTYVRACVENYSAERGAVGVPANYGWQKDGTFVHHNTIYTPTGELRKIPMPGLENVYQATDRDGTLDGWRKRFALLSASAYNSVDVLHPLLACAMSGFGSALMEFTGIDGMTFHLGHRESGTGKSYTLRMAASIWGHPNRYRVNASTSDVAMLQRAGLLNSEPLISDEITTKNREKLEWFPSFVFSYSEGGGKDRMEGGANKERINTSFWKGQCLMASNTIVLDYMTGARKHSSEGELRRMLEYNPRIKLRWNDAELALIKTYEENYGIAGPLFVRWVMQNREVVIDMLAKVSARLKKEFDIVDDERFWLAGCTANVTAAILLGDNYAGIINLPVEGIIKSLKKMVTDQRGQMQLSVRTAEDVLADYTTTFYGNLVVFSAADPIGARFGDDTLVEKNTLRTKVAGRVEHEVSPGYVDFYIEEQQLKGHCAALGYGYLDFRAELEIRYRVEYVKRFDLLRKTNGPPMRVNVLKISQPKNEFDALIKEADD